MTREWETGDLVFADVSIGESAVLLRRNGEWWATLTASAAPQRFYRDDQLSNVRPAVVLDPAGLDGAADWIKDGMSWCDFTWNPELREALDGLVSAITPAIEKPRMPEPGWGEKVTAHTEPKPNRRRFLCVRDHRAGGRVWADEGGVPYRWYELIDPEPAS